MSNKPIYTEVNIAKPERVLKKEIVSLYDENAYENAQMENDRIEIKLNYEKQKLDEFRRLVNERVRAYRIARQIQDEYQNMRKQQKMNEIEKLKQKINTQRVKSYVKHKTNLQAQAEKIPPQLLVKTVVESHKLSPPPLIQVEADREYEEQRKRRISLIRSAYGAIERNQSRRIFTYKNKQRSAQNFKSKCLNISSSKSNKSIISVDTLTNDLLDMNLSGSLFNSSSQEPIKIARNSSDEQLVQSSKISKATTTSSSTANATQSSSSSSSDKSMNKYLKYLKHLLREKGNTIILPPLCQCNIGCGSGSTKKSRNDMKLNNLLNENDLSNCANNCLFYNNPKGKKKIKKFNI
jgi:hypothetical protein